MSKGTETIARNKEQAARIKAAQEETQRIVDGGKCPHCGAGLRRNQSLTGWWTCVQRGAEGFRLDDSKPACDWNGFTEF